jgi:aspartyl/glutamyl-tRNA(Asn/Gln) amidotransferase C subunit
MMSATTTNAHQCASSAHFSSVKEKNARNRNAIAPRRKTTTLASASSKVDNAASSSSSSSSADLPPLPNLTELADTARIKITEEELSDWEPKINAIVGWFGQLNDIDIEKEWERLGKLQVSQEEMEKEMRLRLKSTEEGIEFDREELLGKAKNFEKGYFRTPRIMGSSDSSSSGSSSGSDDSESSSSGAEKAVDQLKASAAAGTSGSTQALNEDLLGFNLVVGEILSCEQHPDPESSKLLVSRVDCGEPEPRSVCSGIAAHYANPQDLVGKKVVIVGNLKARNMKGVQSHGMCLCASNEDKSKIEVVEAPEGSSPGERLTFSGFTGDKMPDIHGENKVVKKKLWDKVKDGFNSNAEGNVNWFGSDLIGVNGCVKAPSLKSCRVG